MRGRKKERSESKKERERVREKKANERDIVRLSGLLAILAGYALLALWALCGL